MYWVVQVLTLGVLVLAANTSYQGFPRLAALLARDRFFARQFTNLGDRLVFSNGIVVLTAVACALLWVYDASVDSLIHLYVIGVFTAFTISQAGMVRYWLRTRDSGWRHRVAFNAAGASATGLVTLVVIWTKFARGRLARDRRDPAARAGLPRHQPALPALRPAAARRRRAPCSPRARPTNETLLWADSIDVATEGALWYARADHGRRAAARAPRAGPAHRHRDPAALVGLRRRRAAARDPARGRGTLERDARGGVAASARRRGLRDGRRSRSSSGGSRCSRRRGARRSGSSCDCSPSPASSSRTCRRSRASARPRDRRRSGSPCGCSSTASTRASLRAVNYARSLGIADTRAVIVRVRRRRGRRVRARLGRAPVCRRADRPERRPVPRHRHAAPRLPPAS